MKDYVKESQSHFDKQAETYDSNTSLNYSGAGKVSCADAEEFLSDFNYNNLLDVGCGTGFLIDNLAAKKDAEYHGLDLSEKMIEVAESKNIKNAHFKQGLADCLPYEDNSFDVVTCIQSFHHYPDSDKAMKEAYRVLKPGGLYLLSDTGVSGIAGWVENNIIFKLLKSGDCHIENRHDIADRMRRNGFTDICGKQIKGFIYTVVGYKPDAE